MSLDDWPPAIGATVRTASGETFEVVSRFEHGGMTTVVLRHPIASGWKARAVTRATWLREGLGVVP